MLAITFATLRESKMLPPKVESRVCTYKVQKCRIARFASLLEKIFCPSVLILHIRNFNMFLCISGKYLKL